MIRHQRLTGYVPNGSGSGHATAPAIGLVGMRLVDIVVVIHPESQARGVILNIGLTHLAVQSGVMRVHTNVDELMIGLFLRLVNRSQPIAFRARHLPRRQTGEQPQRLGLHQTHWGFVLSP